MNFEWDEDKNRINRAKHGLAFEDAEIIFAGKTLTIEDTRLNYGEPRFITLGELAGRVVVIVHTPRNDAIRIISTRKANEREQAIYQK